MLFDSNSMKAEYLKEEADYQGVRVIFAATLGNTRIPLQLDVGFNDIVTMEPEPILFPVILDHPAPKLQGYTPDGDCREAGDLGDAGRAKQPDERFL